MGHHVGSLEPVLVPVTHRLSPRPVPLRRIVSVLTIWARFNLARPAAGGQPGARANPSSLRPLSPAAGGYMSRCLPGLVLGYGYGRRQQDNA
jgi:hypothetical protein